MFNGNEVAKPPKPLNKVAQDVSHARRYNWFFETIKRFGKSFGVSISENRLQGWANNLAYKVSIGSRKDPKFTIFSDGTDGWYRVDYKGRGEGSGSAPSDREMDIHFVGSSYGMFGVYNPKIYIWMHIWANKHLELLNDKVEKKNSHGGYKLDYYTSMAINLKNNLIGL